MFLNKHNKRKYNIVMEWETYNDIETIRNIHFPHLEIEKVQSILRNWKKTNAIWFTKKNKSKKINYNDLTKEQLITIIEIYEELKEEIDREKSKKGKMLSLINKHKKKVGIKFLCKFFNISRTTYYNWVYSDRTIIKYDQKLNDIIVKLYWKYKGDFGYRKLKFYLEREHSIKRNIKTVYKYLHRNGLKCQVKPKKKPGEVKVKYSKSPYLIMQDFHAERPGQKLFTDVSYIKHRSGWCYLSIVVDSFNNEILDWNLSIRNDSELVVTNVKNALTKINSIPIINSDHGVQYFSSSYSKMILENKFVSSMSRVANPIDNLPVEKTFDVIKNEKLRHYKIYQRDFIKLKKEIFPKIIYEYNNERIQSCLGYKTPIEYKMLKL